MLGHKGITEHDVVEPTQLFRRVRFHERRSVLLEVGKNLFADGREDVDDGCGHRVQNLRCCWGICVREPDLACALQGAQARHLIARVQQCAGALWNVERGT